MPKPLLLFFAILLLVNKSHGQEASYEKKLDALLNPYFKANEPGGSILVVKQGKVIYNKAFGLAEIELNVALKPEMVFKIASITKQFTAIAILQLAEKGKLTLQDSIQKFIADYPFKGHTISIEHLLTHTSGITDYMQIDYANPYMERWDFNPKQLIDTFKNYPLQFEPGTKYGYSNSGYFLLGYIIEKVSGKSYQAYIKDNIIAPLNLQHSFFDMENNIIPGRVKGYRKEGAVYKNADFWSATIAYSAGGLLSNTMDLYKWFKGLLSHTIIQQQSLEKAFTAFTLKNGTPINYGYGWYIENKGSAKSIEHAGKMNGFIANQLYYPVQDIFIAALFNNENAPKDELSRMISEIVLEKSLQAEAIKPPASTLNKYVGVYELTTSPGRTITVSKAGNGLVAKISGQSSFEIIFETLSAFQLKNIKDMNGEFIAENGIVTKIIVQQNGQYEWKKIK